MSKCVSAHWPILMCLAALLLPLVGCASSGSVASSKTLLIRWQRLVDTAGDTCDRCGGTEQSLNEARRLLASSLKPLGMQVRVIKTPLTAEQFKLDPSESNRIWIGEEPLEDILGAKTGASTCSGCCGDSPCRTMVVDGQSFETIPPNLIVRAGLRAAADLLHPAKPSTGCCPSDSDPPRQVDSALQPMPWMSR